MSVYNKLKNDNSFLSVAFDMSNGPVAWYGFFVLGVGLFPTLDAVDILGVVTGCCPTTLVLTPLGDFVREDNVTLGHERILVMNSWSTFIGKTISVYLYDYSLQ